jgi:peptidoglycan/LPS O-acetylase OafA/YrhL
MLINPPDAAFQTEIVILILAAALLGTLKFSRGERFFSLGITNQLKGLAILAIVFSHIGYFLSSNTRFLYPMSVLAGVGVNLFLFLSGFGLTTSSINKVLSPVQFYAKRLAKLFIPLWTILLIFYLLDFFILSKTYDLSSILLSFIGVFRQADLYKNLDSPLWYFTMILFYYLVYPWIFKRKLHLLSPIILIALSYLVLSLPLPLDYGVVGLYKVHSLAFPLGMAASILLHEKRVTQPIHKALEYFKTKRFLSLLSKSLIVLCLTYIFCYTALHSGVGHGYSTEQTHSLITTGAIVLIFLISRFQTKVFNIFGKYSYEIYLLHWPILYRYDLIYKVLPAYLATLIYLLIFIGLGFVFQRSINSFYAKYFKK